MSAAWIGQPSSPASSQLSAGGREEQVDQAGFVFGTFSDLGLIDRSVVLPHDIKRKRIMHPPPFKFLPHTGGAALRVCCTHFPAGPVP